MRKILIILSTIFLLFSCTTGLGIRKADIKHFDKNYSATVGNKAFKVKGRRYGSPTLLNLFEIQNETTDSILIEFKDNELILIYKDNGTRKVKEFKGSFLNKGYYEIYLRNERKEIPLFVPIIYGRYNINRIRMAQTIQGDLIIDNQWNESGHILFFGAGDSGRRQSFFKTYTGRN